MNKIKYKYIVILLLQTMCLYPFPITAKSNSANSEPESVDLDELIEIKNEDFIPSSESEGIPNLDPEALPNEPLRVIGKDERELVNSTNVFPYCAIAMLSITYENSSLLYRGTGFFINEDTLLTAGHNLYNHSVEVGESKPLGKMTSMKIYPAYNNGLGRYGGTEWTAVFYPTSWLDEKNDSADYGIIKIEDPIGFKTGRFSLSIYPSLNVNYTISGYPVYVNNSKTNQQWKKSGKLTSITDYLLSYKIDTSGGQSGSPIFDNYNRVIGIHTSGSSTSNYGVKLTSGKLKTVDDTLKDRISIFRLYNPNSGEHFYTLDVQEYYDVENAGWTADGFSWFSKFSGKPVYRLYNPNAGDHHYTTSIKEKDNLVQVGWKYEKVAFYTSEILTSNPVYRLYNPNAKAGAHLYTLSLSERNFLIQSGWRDEGVAWYVE